MDNLQQYYQQRAKEHEAVYEKPERQDDLEMLHVHLQELVSNANVLEIACGTGYWTKTMAKTCRSIQAIDYSTSVLEIAQAKEYGNTPVTFQQQDFWKLQAPKVKYDIVFGGFIWSHIPKEKLIDFLLLLRQQIKEDGKLLFIDNRYVAGSSTSISRTDKNGNTYQLRKLADGTEYEILKNFPDHLEVLAETIMIALDVVWSDLQYYWIGDFRNLKY